MVFVQSTFRVTRFARDLPLSVGGELGAGGSLSYPIPGIAPGGSGYVNVGIPGTGGPFDVFPLPGQGFPGFPGPGHGGVNPQIVKVSIPRPINAGSALTIYLWFAASFGPRQYAMRTEIPELGYNHTTPYIFVSGPGVYQIQNTFTLPADTPTGEVQGTLKLLTNEQGTTNITIADDEPFVLIVQGENAPPPPNECPPGASKVNGVCTCTDPAKEIWQNLCVQKCPEGYTRDATSGVCELNTCPEGQHRNDQGICVPDVQPCPEGQYRYPPTGQCVPNTCPTGTTRNPTTYMCDPIPPDPTCPTGQHRDSYGNCVPDTPPPPPPPGIPPICASIENPLLKQICIQFAGSSCATDATDEADTFREFCDSMGSEQCERLCKKIFKHRYEDEDDDDDYPQPPPPPPMPQACSSEWIEALCERYDDNPRAYSRCKQILNWQCRRRRHGRDHDRRRRRGRGRGSGSYGGGAYASAGGTSARAGGGGAYANAGGVTAQAGLARSYHPYGGYGRWTY